MEREEEAVVIEQGSPEAVKVARAMASSSSGKILDVLREEGPLSLSDLAEKMNLPINSTKYHLEHLVDAGLVEITTTRWSEKGKAMKIYAAVEKDIILRPKKKSATTELIKKYGTAAGIITLCCAGIPLISHLLATPEPENTVMETFAATKAISDTVTSGTGESLFDSASDSQFLSILSQADWICIVFFLAAISAIVIMFLLSLAKSRKT